MHPFYSQSPLSTTTNGRHPRRQGNDRLGPAPVPRCAPTDATRPGANVRRHRRSAGLSRRIICRNCFWLSVPLECIAQKGLRVKKGLEQLQKHDKIIFQNNLLGSILIFFQ
jgi:hypothetical protein